ncbi:multiheme c-type cytochrome [Nannocystis punicea]|uniref:Multiheme c-type cytochrome n=1 Tax=Nannocystis punicea TaxID=2995304 RepID=A0ABY7H530_9BACT|nr:multiheme c-type cytochrome [Nannocystis poenicansa]WAS94297.1 multiheme c-type cytochrome [Nannocystis poenicansa]
MTAFSRGAWLTASLALATSISGRASAATEPGSLQNPLEKAEDCRECHAFANPPDHAGEPNVSPIAWAGGMMANAARDPVFWAGVAIAAQDMPGETDSCVRCHAPRAFVAGRDGATAIDDLEPDDLSGVDCDTCHRMIDDGMTPPGDAHYTIDDMVGDAGDVPKQGPWSYDGGDKPMHSWVVGDLLGRSEHCGTCHDVTTGRDRLDARGQPVGAKFNEQRTYSEWLASAYAAQGLDFKSCQDCHMPAVDNVAGCAEFNGQGTFHPTGGRRHDLAGANRRMVEILKSLYGSEGSGDIEDAYFDLALAGIDLSLGAAATLEVTAPAEIDLQAGIDAWGVKVTNNTGHKLPTGYSEGRVMWLEVTATYMSEVVYASGRWIAGEGLEGDAQQRTYEAIAVHQQTGATNHLLLNDYWQVDSRIPPKGLQAGLETDPVGDRYALLPDETWPNWDEVVYTFGPQGVLDVTPGEPDVLDLRVRLLYVINTPTYLEFLASENHTNSAGADAQALFPVDPDPLVLAEWTASVPATGLVQEAETSDSSDGTSDGTGDAPTTSATAGSSSGTESTGATPTSTTADATDSATTSGQTGGDDGCGCRQQSGPAGGLALLLLALGRRRRTRR